MDAGEFSTVAEVLKRSSARFKARVAYRDAGCESAAITYGNTLRAAGRIAGFLRANGVALGDRVCIYAPNGPEWPLAFWGVVSCGAVAVPIDPNSGSAEIGHILRDTGAQWVFAAPSLAGKLAGFRLKGVVTLGGAPPGGGGGRGLTDIVKGPARKASLPEQAADAPAMIIYTSGTTSQPKGVVLTGRGILSVLAGMRGTLALDDRDVFLSAITLSHTFEITCGLILPCMVGASVVYARDLKYTNLFRGMQRFRPTAMLCPPLMFRVLLENVVNRVAGRRALSLAEVERDAAARRALGGQARRIFGGAVRFFLSGGAPLAPAIAAGYREMGIPLLQVYGLTETSGPSTLTPPGDFPPGSAGRALPGVDLRIDRPGRDGVGEICIRGPHLMAGYYNNDKATRETIRGGWLHSGDLGHIDAEGHLFVTGRSKNVIVTAAGTNVYPEEIEQRIARSPFVREVCVLGKQHPDRTETVFASIVVNDRHLGKFVAAERRAGREPPALADLVWREVQSHTADLASFKRVSGFQLRSRSLPRGRTGKVVTDRVKRESFSILGRLGRLRGHDAKEAPLVFLNATAVTPFRIAEKACVAIETGKITQLGSQETVFLPPNARVIDIGGRYLVPGFIDLHVHGGNGHDFSRGDRAEFEAILDYFVSHGTTRLLATVYVEERGRFLRAIRSLAAGCRARLGHGALHGIHLEGPFISRNMRGALNEKYIWDATIENQLTLQRAGRGCIGLMTLAPELPGVQDVMQVAAQEGIALAVAHSEASYEDIEAAIDLGLTQVTHIFNAMPSLHHRTPGILAAAFQKRELKVHLIADGFHVHPAVVELLYKLKGSSGIVLISDAIHASGCPDGTYTLAERTVKVRRGKAYLEDGTLAGSTVTLDKSLQFMMENTDIPLQEAVRMATLNPARVLGLDHERGILAVGKDADMVVLDAHFNVD
ncbi:MAG: N-acetylglucosamine-6-phosphate deacetylase, partial [Lentisphaeria bacterium]|nr:N-acetylglucosamine-6-phosphate deacetylase [Lentisphaeria bacterium]